MGKRAIPVISIILILGALGFSQNAFAPLFDEVAKLTASDAAAFDQFGQSVSISGDTAIVGAPLNDDAGSDSGSAYIFEKDSVTGIWNQVAKLTASDATAGDEFGESVSISGDTVIVGARFDDVGIPSIIVGNTAVAESVGTTSLQLWGSSGYSGLTPGESIIKIRTEIVNFNCCSSVRVAVYNSTFDLIPNGASIIQPTAIGFPEFTFTTPPKVPSDGFIYILFMRQPNFELVTWRQGTAGGSIKLDISNDFNNPTPTLTDDGILRGPGDHMFAEITITQEFLLNSGSAYVFEKPAGGWADSTQTAQLTASDAAASDFFGSSVSISGDTGIVGTNSDSAYVFVKPAGGWVDSTQTAKLTASDVATGGGLNEPVSISADTAIVGNRGDDHAGSVSGSAYVFVKPAGGWADSTQTAKLTASDAAAGDEFGISVSISGDTAIVGAQSDDSASGSAYVFVKPGTGWAGSLNEDAKLTASDAAAADIFGGSVSISGDTTIVGALLDDDAGSFSGSAYIFVKPAGGWAGSLNEDVKLTASDAALGDQFGISVSISGDAAIVGAFGDDDAGTVSGSAYVFELMETDLSITKADSPDPVTAGNQLTYTLTVNNAGPSDAQNVVVTDTLPAEVTLGSVTSSQGGCVALPCNLGTITSGGSATVTITVTVNSDVTTSPLSNTADVTSSTSDPDGTNNSSTSNTVVNTSADVSITKADSPDPVTAGNQLTYTLTVNNAGTSDAQNVVVTDTLPAEVTLGSVTSSQGGCVALPCNLGTITSGGSATVTITVTVNFNALGTLTNTASVTSDTNDPDNSNNAVTEDTTSEAGPPEDPGPPDEPGPPPGTPGGPP